MTATSLPRHERLTAWQACDALTRALYRETASWDEEYLGVLGEELRKGATAAIVQIVLGSVSGNDRAFRKHLRTALGKLARLDAAWLMARDLGVVPPERWGELEAMRDHAEQLTRGLYLALGRRAR
jgi:hypothetical protein